MYFFQDVSILKLLLFSFIQFSIVDQCAVAELFLVANLGQLLSEASKGRCLLKK